MSNPTPITHGVAPAPGLCANCGEALIGRYCHACGQVGHVHRSLLHLTEELLHGVLHFDAKALRTLPLLAVRPGLLTRRYLQGQRVRYLNPLTLFLFSIFLLLFVVSIQPTASPTHRITPPQRQSALAGLEQEVTHANDEVAAASAALDRARARGSGVTQAESDLSDARTEQRIVTAALQAMRITFSGADAEDGTFGSVISPWLGFAANLAQSHPPLASALKDIQKNPDLYFYRLREAGSHFAFLLIPISLPFLSLLFVRRRDVSAYDHAIFSLYSLSFMSLLMVLVTLLGDLSLGGLAATAVLVVPPIHMFAQLRGTYQLSIAGALWRAVALLAVAGTVFLLFLLLLVIIALH